MDKHSLTKQGFNGNDRGMDKVLLVDDEVEICLLLSGILQRHGFKTAYALSLKEARELLATNSYDVIFLDLNLPDGIGYQLIPAIKDRSEDAKIIIVSAYDVEKKKAKEEGADYFISKPFTTSKILEALKLLDFN